jgi:hypothetical protein
MADIFTEYPYFFTATNLEWKKLLTHHGVFYPAVQARLAEGYILIGISLINCSQSISRKPCPL